MGDVAVGVGLYFGAQVVTGVLLVAWLVLTGNLDTGSSADEITDDIGLVSILLGVPLAWVALFGWPWWLSRRKGSGSLARDFGWAFRPIDLATGIGGGVAGIVAAGLAAVSYQAVFGNEAPTNTDIIPSDVPVLTMVLVFLVIAVGTPIAEEMFFRGLFLGAARKAWGTKVGVAVSSIGFGLAHIQPSPVAWLYVGVVTGSYGLVFALLRVWSQGRLAAPIIAHMTVNAVGVVAVFATSP
jgi:membrane protease YdiL (CAAX protease family)